MKALQGNGFGKVPFLFWKYLPSVGFSYLFEIALLYHLQYQLSVVVQRFASQWVAHAQTAWQPPQNFPEVNNLRATVDLYVCYAHIKIWQLCLWIIGSRVLWENVLLNPLYFKFCLKWKYEFFSVGMLSYKNKKGFKL